MMGERRARHGDDERLDARPDEGLGRGPGADRLDVAYRLTRKVADDIRHIYIEGARRFGAVQAEAHHARSERTFEPLAANPVLARERTELVPPVRIHPSGAHVVVYLAAENGDVVIVRVRLGREDWEAG